MIERCLEDEDNSVRYYSCEALYNVIKVSQHHIIPFFDLLFEDIKKLSDDTNFFVRDANQCVNRLLQDIATSFDRWDVQPFVEETLVRIISDRSGL